MNFNPKMGKLKKVKTSAKIVQRGKEHYDQAKSLKATQSSAKSKDRNLSRSKRSHDSAFSKQSDPSNSSKRVKMTEAPGPSVSGVTTRAKKASLDKDPDLNDQLSPEIVVGSARSLINSI